METNQVELIYFFGHLTELKVQKYLPTSP